MKNRIYLCIDLKSFYASVGCIERGLDAMTTNLVVAVLWVMQSLITFVFGKKLLGIYAPNDLGIVEWGWRKFTILGYTYGLLGLMNVMSGAIRGMGASFLNMIMAIVGTYRIGIL